MAGLGRQHAITAVPQSSPVGARTKTIIRATLTGSHFDGPNAWRAPAIGSSRPIPDVPKPLPASTASSETETDDLPHRERDYCSNRNCTSQVGSSPNDEADIRKTPFEMPISISNLVAPKHADSMVWPIIFDASISRSSMFACNSKRESSSRPDLISQS